MKIDRLIGILSILLQKEVITAPELAEHFEVSRRTIGRDVEALSKAGIPIRTMQGTGGGISIMNGYRMDRTLLTSRDMQMILAGLRSLDSVSGSRYYGQLMEKIQAGSSELISGRDSILIDLSSWYRTSLAPKIAAIQDAIEAADQLQFLVTVINVYVCQRLAGLEGTVADAVHRGGDGDACDRGIVEGIARNQRHGVGHAFVDNRRWDDNLAPYVTKSLLDRDGRGVFFIHREKQIALGEERLCSCIQGCERSHQNKQKFSHTHFY